MYQATVLGMLRTVRTKWSKDLTANFLAMMMQQLMFGMEGKSVYNYGVKCVEVPTITLSHHPIKAI